MDRADHGAAGVSALMFEEKDPEAAHKGKQVLKNISMALEFPLPPSRPHPCPLSAGHGGCLTTVLVLNVSRCFGKETRALPQYFGGF